jgi:hypothetical protein
MFETTNSRTHESLHTLETTKIVMFETMNSRTHESLHILETTKIGVNE